MPTDYCVQKSDQKFSMVFGKLATALAASQKRAFTVIVAGDMNCDFNYTKILEQKSFLVHVLNLLSWMTTLHLPTYIKVHRILIDFLVSTDWIAIMQLVFLTPYLLWIRSVLVQAILAHSIKSVEKGLEKGVENNYLPAHHSVSDDILSKNKMSYHLLQARLGLGYADKHFSLNFYFYEIVNALRVAKVAAVLTRKVQIRTKIRKVKWKLKLGKAFSQNLENV